MSMIISLLIMPTRTELSDGADRRPSRNKKKEAQPKKTHEQRIREAVALRAGSSTAGVLGVSNRTDTFHLLLRSDGCSSGISFCGLVGVGVRWISGRIQLFDSLGSDFATGGYQESFDEQSALFIASGGIAHQPNMLPLNQRVMSPDLLNRLAQVAEHGHVNSTMTTQAVHRTVASR